MHHQNNKETLLTHSESHLLVELYEIYHNFIKHLIFSNRKSKMFEKIVQMATHQ